MPLFRCLNCTKDFEADRPACAGCGVDPETNPRHANVVVRLETIHYDAPTHVPGIGVGHAACDPAVKVGRGKVMASGEASAVNCPACKRTEAFRRAGESPPRPADSIRINRLESPLAGDAG